MNQRGKIRSIWFENWGWFVVGIIVLPTLIYLLLRGENIYIQPHDNLDSNVAWYKLLRENGLFFSQNVLAPAMGGINRDYLSSEFKLYSLLYFFLPTFSAYIIGLIFKIIFSLFFNILLCKEIFGQEYKKYKNIVILCGFLYGILPTFPTTSMSFASLPLFIYLILVIYRNPKKKIYLLLVFFYPILAEFVTFGIFYCAFLLLLILGDSLINRRVKWNLVASLVLLSLGFVLTEYRLFKIMLFFPERTIRETMRITFMSFFQSFNLSVSVFRQGDYFAGTLQRYILFPVCFLFFLYKNYFYIREKKFKTIFIDIFNILMFIQMFNSLVYGFYYFYPLNHMVATLIPPLKGFNYGRVEWCNPFLLTAAFSMVLMYLVKHGHVNLSRIIAMLSILVILVTPEVYNDISSNIRNSIKQELGRPVSELTYKEFFSTELFDEIKKDIDYNCENSVAFCFHPSILTYNNISTLDGYLSYMSQDYKEQFRRLIVPSLERNEENRKYFDDWGGRAYVFPVAGTYKPIRELPYEETEFYFDPIAFKEMGGKYVFSRVKISNASDMQLELIKKYENKISPYVIYLYSIM